MTYASDLVQVVDSLRLHVGAQPCVDLLQRSSSANDELNDECFTFVGRGRDSVAVHCEKDGSKRERNPLFAVNERMILGKAL